MTEPTEETPLVGNTKPDSKTDIIQEDDAFLIDEENNQEGSHVKQKVRPTCCHSVFIFFNTYSAISLVLLVISQFAPFYFIKIEGLHLYLRIYIAFFSFILFLIELEVPYFAGQNGLSENWILRGIFHSFLGLINQEESLVISSEAKNNLKISNQDDLTEAEILIELLVQVSSYMMVISGILYGLMGLLCLKGVKEKYQQSYRESVEKERQREIILKEENILHKV